MSVDIGEPWRNLILHRLKDETNKTKPFERFFDSYRTVCDRLSRVTKNDARRRGSSFDVEDSALAEKLEDLQATHQEMLKKKEVNDQRLITAKYDVERLEKEKLALLNERNKTLKKCEELQKKAAHISDYAAETEQAMTVLKEEHREMQALNKKLSENLRQCEMDRDDLLKRLIELKMKQDEMVCWEAEQAEERLHQVKIEQINENVKNMPDNFEFVNELGDDLNNYFCCDVLPSYLRDKIEAHTGDVTDLIWLQNGETFFSASSDHTVLEYDVSGTVPVKRAKFTGSTQGIMRLDVNIEQTMVLGACNDKKLRIWGIADQRCRHELTGHTDKVVTAKFLANGTEVASGSSDRTVKLWDLRQRRCVRTCMVGSTVFDLVTNDKIGCPIISGHYDKKIRFWDPRTEHEVETLPMEGKITSLCVSSDSLSLLCATRDETLSLIDLRMMESAYVYSSEQYRTTSDYSKCCISPGMQYIAAGSADGSVFVWNLRSTKLEKTLSKGHGTSPVLALAWHPRGNILISGDKKRTVCVWR
ncbi:hypothetical protein QR680_019089 [Steinernema hermaphroditum]|uniref:Autophagy-related protein 16 domain-containing protein n=1 Tax=Steinernema hermaphroditum TaxID=289476 RepID=A0AA39HM36_9BILA|nr:hypothetical protein QR680_019089 [Steinernema hermaphroditum]